MTSNKLRTRRYAIANPKICKSKPKPLRPIQPPEPPQWPPPYINAKITALVYGQQFEASLILMPDPPAKPKVISYSFHDYALEAEVDLYTTLTPPQILFSRVRHNYPPTFTASYGGYQTIQPPTFNLQTSKWAYQSPEAAQITLAIAYPGEP